MSVINLTMSTRPTPTRTPTPGTKSSTTNPNSANRNGNNGPVKPSLNMSDNSTSINPSQWLNFSLPPRQPRQTGPQGVPRRSRKGEGWRGGVMSRERYVQANFRFVLKPTEMLSYGAHFADPDIPLHWPNILQVLVPTFSAISVAQGYVSSDRNRRHRAGHHDHDADDDLARSLDEDELDAMPDEAAERRRRIEEERRGRACPICLGKPVSGRMTKCGHIFCFPCILHYIQLSDIPRSAKCPICGDTVHEGMLKSVKYLDAGAMLSAAEGEDDGPIPSDSDTDRDQPGSAVPEVALQGDRHLSKPEEVHDDHGLGIIGHLEGFEDQDATPKAADVGRPFVEDIPEVAAKHRIHMRLVQRPQMTTLALPSSPTWPSDAIPPHTAPWYFLPDVLSHSRFMLASPDYMLSELHRELGELKAEWDSLRGDDLGRDFIRAAKEKVERQIGKVKGELMTDLVERNQNQSRDAWGEAVGGERRAKEQRRERERRARERADAAKKESEAADATSLPSELLATQSVAFDGSTPTPNRGNRPNIDIPPNMPVEPNPMPSSSRKSRRRAQAAVTPSVPSIPASSNYYFYQSSLGANVFLHPLDIRILLAHFKSYSLFPQTLSFTSSGFDPGTINEELRKRCKYLGHLPAGTEVIFVEADLEEIVGKEGLAAFEQPLKARREKRRARTRKEDRAKSRWEKQEREKMPQLPNLAAAYGTSGGGREDQAFTDALMRSAAEAGVGSLDTSGGYLGSSLEHGYASASSSRLGPSPGTSPSGTTTVAWGESGGGGGGGGGQRTFASTLSSAHTGAVPRRRVERRERTEDEWEVDAVWDAFNEINLGPEEPDDFTLGSMSMRESVKGGGSEGVRGKGGGGPGKKPNKKSNKKTLVLGGGGGRGVR